MKKVATRPVSQKAADSLARFRESRPGASVSREGAVGSRISGVRHPMSLASIRVRVQEHTYLTPENVGQAAEIVVRELGVDRPFRGQLPCY